MVDDPLEEMKEEIEEIADLGDGGDSPTPPDGPLERDAGSEYGVDVEWPEVEPVERNLSPQEWGIYGEGLDSDREKFAEMLNDGRLGSQPAEIRRSPPTGWGEVTLSELKERGKHLFTSIGVTPETMLRVQGQIGENQLGTPAREFATDVAPKVEDYTERFEAGERPRKFYVFLTNDGELDGPQEGRHRAAAAMMAGLNWVPSIVLWNTAGTFRRPNSFSDGTAGYRSEYPDA
jgi:hypothetical protein